VVVKDAGHILPEDQPEEVARLMRAFIKDTPPPVKIVDARGETLYIARLGFRSAD
jgi:hypothetical protein